MLQYQIALLISVRHEVKMARASFRETYLKKQNSAELTMDLYEADTCTQSTCKYVRK